jgi:hypothetical protein
MKAQLTTKYNRDGNLTYEIKAGEKGTGKSLWRCTSWDNPKATEQAERMAWQFAQQKGIKLVEPTE